MKLARIALCLAVGLAWQAADAAELHLVLPQERTAFQTNEWIDLSVVRTNAGDLAAGPLELTLTGADGSRVAATFAAPAVKANAGKAAGTEHLHVSGWLLRPGKYAVAVKADGAAAKAEIDVFTHVRRSEFRTINWGRAKGPAQQVIQGEHNLGFNTFYGHYGQDEEASLIRAGVDFISNCTMGGAHQMDIRSECDWSDPYVTRGGTQRVVRRAIMDRTRPNVPGVHFYDEPGLTWEKHPATGETTPHGIAPQIRAYEAAFGVKPLQYNEVDPNNPEHVARWKHWATWKLGFMDAAWKESQFGVSTVRNDFLSLTQSQYGWTAFTDGYYFNVARSLPITSGHGGYHDYGPGYFNPSMFLEMARARDHWKSCWYLPTWYGNTTPDQFRAEQYFAFQTNIQGMISPPDIEPATNAGPRQGVVESNHLMLRLGTIFHTMPVTKPPVAMLYSLSQALHTQTKDRSANYAHATRQGKNLPLVYLAGKLIQHQFHVLVDEDIRDGSLDEHQAIVISGVDYLDPLVVKSLEAFAARGGLVLLTADAPVAIQGATKLNVTPAMPDQAIIDELHAKKAYQEAAAYETTGKWFAGAMPLAKAIAAELQKKGIRPVFQSDVATIVASRQQAGDIEYLFAVNATFPEGSRDKNALAAAEATLSIPDDGRPVYDAVLGQPAPFTVRESQLAAKLRFGPGQMKVFARTARPIAGVRASTPVVTQQLVVEKEPISVELGAALVDGSGRVLSGSAPLAIQVVDPLGAVRHDLFRATRLGLWNTRVPLAANDPEGEWTVVVRELLSGTEDKVKFRFNPPARATAIAGATPRAMFADNDRDNAFRFIRQNHVVTIVAGKSPFNAAAAERVTNFLAPWGVKCQMLSVDEAAKPRVIAEGEARTWIGLHPGKATPGDKNPPQVAGFNVSGPVILIGNPEDHAILAYLLKEKFLNYTPKAGVIPGAGRGYVAWQRDGVGKGQESIALIAHDEAGMAEAAGSLYEAIAGIDPLTRWTLPNQAAIAPAKSAHLTPAAPVVWQAAAPDRVVGFATEGGLKALSSDNSETALSAEGKAAPPAALPAPPTPAAVDAAAVKQHQTRLGNARLVKQTLTHGSLTAVACWGGYLELVDPEGKAKFAQELPQDITALASAGGRLIVGLADGRVVALDAK